MKVTLVITTTLNMHVITCMKSTIEVADMHEARRKFKEAIEMAVLTTSDSAAIKGIVFKDGDYPLTKIRDSFAEAVTELIEESISPIVTVKVYYKSKVIRTFTISVE